MESAFEILRDHIRQAEQTRDEFYQARTPKGDREAMFAEKIIQDSLQCFIAMLETKDIFNRADLLGSLLLDSTKIARERIEYLA